MSIYLSISKSNYFTATFTYNFQTINEQKIYKSLFKLINKQTYLKGFI